MKLKTEFISFEGGNVRLVQMGVALQHLSHVISEVAPGAPLVFCGDFNSSPISGNSTPEGPTTAAPVSASIHFVFVRLMLKIHYLFWYQCVFLLVMSAGVFQLVTEALVPQQHEDWSSSGPEESCSMELPSAFPPLLSACSEPAYTNYVGGFHGCLDYIFIQPDSMQVMTLMLVQL